MGKKTLNFANRLLFGKLFAFCTIAAIVVACGRYSLAQPRTLFVNQAPILEAHTTAVRAIAFSFDGRLIASGDEKGEVKLWDAQSGQLKRVLISARGYNHAVYNIAFSPKNDLVAVGGAGGIVSVWSVSEGLQQLTLEHPDADGYNGQINLLQFSKDGQTLFVVHFGWRLQIWDMRKGLLTREPHPLSFVRIGALSISPDEKILAARSDDGVSLWDIGQTKQIGSFGANILSTGVAAVDFSPDGRSLVTAGSNAVHLWDISSRSLLRPFPHEEYVNHVLFDSTGRLFISADGPDGRSVQISLWNVLTGQRLDVASAGSRNLWSLALSPDGRFVVGGSDEGAIHRWQLEKE